jgi:chromosome partitioning protein
MFTVALVAQKGGVGKTTLLLTLAALAEAAGHTVAIIDCDESRSVSKWGARRKTMLGKSTFDAVNVYDVLESRRAKLRKDGKERAAELLRDVEIFGEIYGAAKDERIDWVFLDTSAGVSALAGIAAKSADLVLIPCTPARLDMDAMGPTATLARQVGRPSFFVVNKGRKGKAINNDCAVALTSKYGLPAAATHLELRVPVSDVVDQGATILEATSRDASTVKAQEEFRALWRWVQGRQNAADEAGETEHQRTNEALHG